MRSLVPHSRRSTLSLCAALAVLVVASCGDDTSSGSADPTIAPTSVTAATTATSAAAVTTTTVPATTSPTATTSPSATTAPTASSAGPAADDDAALAAQAIVAPADLGDGWRTLGETLNFPNSAELAATVPECAEFVDLVFDGGSQHGRGLSTVLAQSTDPIFSYVVVFPTEDAAAEMLAAVATPEFDTCWARFNEVAVVQMPLGLDGAAYESKPPYELDVVADEVSVKFLEGQIDINGTQLRDTCFCVFARVGRGVVEVHSTALALTPDQRAVVVQAAIDKLRSTLSAA